MVVILINGAPGSGKTTLAFKLADKLSIDQVIQTDTLKLFFRINNHSPISLIPSHEVWKLFGKKTSENIIKSFNIHTISFERFLLKAVNLTQEEGKDIIIEGVHATPKLFNSITYKNKIGFFLDVSEKELIKRYDQKNEKRSKKKLGRTKTSKLLK